MGEALLIGDVIGSRESADRAALHRSLQAALAAVNDAFAPPVPLQLQVGDEFQGVFATLGDALAATLHLRLALLPAYDVRQGVGRGSFEVFSRQPRVEDGPGWWSARSAVERVEARDVRSMRTAYDPGDSGDPAVGAVNAALMMRDDRVGSLDERSLSVLRGLMADKTQKQVAEELSISASAVSQRVRGDGLAAVVAAHEALAQLD